MPKILECDDDGGPLKWEFICIPIPFGFDIFYSRGVLKRASYAAVLLAIQRHTNRICLALDDVDLPAISPVVSESDTLEDPKPCEEELFTDDKIENVTANMQNEAASQCLLDCIRRTSLNSFQ